MLNTKLAKLISSSVPSKSFIYGNNNSTKITAIANLGTAEMATGITLLDARVFLARTKNAGGMGSCGSDEIKKEGGGRGNSLSSRE